MTKSNLKEKEENTTKTTGLYITKIKFKENKAVINYRDEQDLSLKEGTYTGKDEVTEEFKNLFQKAVDTFVELLPELKKSKSQIKMNALRFDYDKQGFLEKVLFSTVWTFNSQGNVINLNTPQFPIYKPEMSETTVAISGKDEELMHNIIDKAKAYMNGDTRTKQMSLIVDNTK
jgi:hypothetical protein